MKRLILIFIRFALSPQPNPTRTLMHPSLDLGAKIQQGDNPGSVETQWIVSKVGEKHKFKNPLQSYTIESNKARGKFLNVHGASYDNGAKLIVRRANSRCKIDVLRLMRAPRACALAALG